MKKRTYVRFFRRRCRIIARIGLIDVDGHHFPNLALMRIAAYHKARGDLVDWWWSDFVHYDVVYKSKVFSDAYSQDNIDPLNVDRIICGGTGYAIRLESGVEVLDKMKDNVLPPEVEAMFPDYSLYPHYNFAVSMTSRGCPNNCPWCHVAEKEGYRSVKVAEVKDFWNGQKEIKILDPNITACSHKRELFEQYIATGALLDFTQGLDIRLLNDADIADLNRMRIKDIHFAWDNPQQDLARKFAEYARGGKKDKHGRYGTVYILTNYSSTMEENLYRVYTVRDLGYAPYIMVYNKPTAPSEIRRLQRWCNNRKIFYSEPTFARYME